MTLAAERLKHALTRHYAETTADADDPRLRGRTYAVPFEQVWQGALSLAGGGLPGWRVRSADDLAGIINATATSRFLRTVHDVKIRISLDQDAQTRIDARSTSRKARADWGGNTRRLVSFFKALDVRLSAKHQQRRTIPSA